MRNPPKLTDVERLTLANQYEILARLEELQGGGHESESFRRRAENLRDGHEWLYNEVFDLVSDVLDEATTNHVLTIIGLYSDLKASYDHLDDKSGIEPYSVEFPGFDGNNEAEMLGFADALIKAGRFSESLKGKTGLNSHFPTRDVYGRMIAKWRELGEPYYPFPKETIIAIVDARIHPDNR